MGDGVTWGQAQGNRVRQYDVTRIMGEEQRLLVHLVIQAAAICLLPDVLTASTGTRVLVIATSLATHP